ncbi:MAG: N-acetylglucosamine-6-phosphate deacetylase [Bacilli bacterium]
MKAIINAHIFTGDSEIESGYILYDEKVQAVGPMSSFDASKATETKDAQGKYVIPGMIDVHIHGGYDVDTMDADAETLVHLSNELLKEGVTSYLPTTMTQHPDAIRSALAAVKEAKKSAPTIAGVHLEGPYVNFDWKGAQPGQFIVPPSVEQFRDWYDASGESIKIVTYAPEIEGATAFEEEMREKGVIGSAGHTGAYRETFETHDVKHFTHLYNQMRGLHHREPGVVGYALMSEGTYVEVIPDGIHIHPEMVKLAYKLKGADHICVITDAMRAKGLPEGAYELGGQGVTVKDGQARLSDGTLAGSVLRMDDAFRNIIAFTGCTMAEAVKMTSVNQATELGLTNKGGIATGKDADFLLLSSDLQLEMTVSLGRDFIF